METKISQKTAIFAILAILIVVVFVSTLFIGRKDEMNPNLHTEKKIGKEKEIMGPVLRIEPSSVKIGRGEVQSVKVFSGEKDVTNQVTWESKDESVAMVTNPLNNAGFVQAFKEGTTPVTARYEERTKELAVEVEKIDLISHCYPSVEKAKVGEEVRWVLAYEKFGTPPYKYDWSGDVQGSEAIAYSKFTEPGIKTTKTITIDTAGTRSEAECSVEVTQ